MNQAAASALMTALRGQKINASAVMTFDSGGIDVWAVLVSPQVAVSGSQLAQLLSYCTTNGLSLAATFATLNVT